MGSIIGIAGAIICMAIEFFYLRSIKKDRLYNYNNLLSNLSIGICERLVYLFMIPVFYNLFNYIYIHFHLFKIPTTWYFWIVLLLFTDLVWYWYHRLGHRVNIFWAAHIVHHQSEDFNLTVAARITIFQAYIRTLFWCILPLIGFDANMVMGILIFHGSYSFFTHTQLGKNLGFLEYVFITPSLHSVHHASNEKYLDKNFGDVFVFWDKLFGTFQKEDEQPIFGLTKKFESHSFLWQHFHYYLELMYQTKSRRRLNDKIKVFFEPPDKMDENIRDILEKKWLKRSQMQMGKPIKFYLNVQLIFCFALLSIAMIQFTNMDTMLKCEFFIFIVLTLINIGAIIEQKKYIFYIELLRIWQLFLYISICMHSAHILLMFSLIVQIVLFIFPIKKWYFIALYRKR